MSVVCTSALFVKLHACKPATANLQQCLHVSALCCRYVAWVNKEVAAVKRGAAAAAAGAGGAAAAAGAGAGTSAAAAAAQNPVFAKAAAAGAAKAVKAQAGKKQGKKGG